MPIHTVKKGECMTQIADAHGFFWGTLWNHPENAEIRRLRKKPNVLLDGDSVFVPEKRQKKVSRPTGEKHVFRVKGIPARFKLRLLDASGNPRAGLPYRLSIDGDESTGETAPDGLVSRIIAPAAKRATLRLTGGDIEEEYVFDLGHLPPVEVVSGVKARLRNLGYYDGEIDDALDDDARRALRDFQVHEGLAATGEIDSRTRAALVSRHES
jgi:N-acetylmuramoyl-L-alanine amidase